MQNSPKIIKRAKMGQNGVFGHFVDVFVIFMTKKCTKTNTFCNKFSQKSEGTAQPFAKSPGGPPPPPFVPP
jgi:hypothetical protein